MIKKIKILTLFSKEIWIATVTTSLVTWSLTDFDTDIYFRTLLGYFLFIKIITNFLIYTLYQSLKTKNYLFYQNLCISQWQLWIFSFSIDCLFFIFIFNIYALFK